VVLKLSLMSASMRIATIIVDFIMMFMLPKRFVYSRQKYSEGSPKKYGEKEDEEED
jgi:hypothetical protein